MYFNIKSIDFVINFKYFDNKYGFIDGCLSIGWIEYFSI